MNKAKHITKMLSLEDIFNLEDLKCYNLMLAKYLKVDKEVIIKI